MSNTHRTHTPSIEYYTDIFSKEKIPNCRIELQLNKNNCLLRANNTDSITNQEGKFLQAQFQTKDIVCQRQKQVAWATGLQFAFY